MRTIHSVTKSGLTLALGAAFVVGCGDQEADPLGPGDLDVAAAKGGIPGPPDGGGGDDGGNDDGGDTDPTLEMAQGLVADAQIVSVKRDNKRSLTVEKVAYSVTMNLASTQSTAGEDLDAEGNVVADPACTWDVPAGAESLSQELVDALVTSTDVTPDLDVEVDKDAALAEAPSSDNFIRLATGSLTPEPTIFLGRSAGPYLTFSYSDGDGLAGNEDRTIHDPAATRSFTANGGLVRAVKRFDEDGDGSLESNEPLVSMTCPLEDGFILTVAPSS